LIKSEVQGPDTKIYLTYQSYMRGWFFWFGILIGALIILPGVINLYHSRQFCIAEDSLVIGAWNRTIEDLQRIHQDTSPEISPNTAYNRIKELAKLKDEGLITSADFEEHKRRIIEGI
jgi:hypothetical protein